MIGDALIGRPLRPLRSLAMLGVGLMLSVTLACRSVGVQERADAPIPEPAAADGESRARGGSAGASPPDDAGSIGENAAAYLRRSVPRMTIEIDAVEGRKPSARAVQHMRSVLQRVADKPGGIALHEPGALPGNRQRYSRSDLVSLERRHRQTTSSSDAASLYILSPNGRFAEDANALGVAYRAGSFAVFQDAITEAASLLSDRARLESAVLTHEVGHLLRLVNIGYTSPRGREDPQHEHHSTHEQSVMHWAIESTVVSRILDGPPPVDFDNADRMDLADIKAGRL